jgi:UDP-N-acetylglucosamine diphosphorylase/glucosamine-1-phosphate N-acetyltransferase
MTDLFLYDDTVARSFEPFALTRPTCELRAGALLLRERWERVVGMKAAGVITSRHLAEFDEPWGTSVVGGTIPAGSLLANSRCAVAFAPAPTADVWRCEGRVAAVLLTRAVDVEELASGGTDLEHFAPPDGRGRRIDIHGRWMNETWDFIAALSSTLSGDITAIAAASSLEPARYALIAGGGAHPVFVENAATVEPHVYFDTAAGPVLIRRRATVQAFTRIVGPVVIGEDSQAGGDKIANTSIGEVCRVHGEVNSTIFLGHSNKAHDGFVGHSYLGRWVNLGAGTITSNLKITYGPVHLWTPRGERDTGQLFLGTMFGDHAKTAINTSLTTGTVLGAGANVYGSAMPPKVVPPFAWGEAPPYSTYHMDKFIEVARRMMSRRHVELSERQARMLEAAFAQRWTTEAEPPR